jgi:hypothetical protein
MGFKLAIAAVAALMMAVGSAQAEGPPIGQVKTATGEAFVLRGPHRYAARPGDPIYRKDIVETGDKGSIGITFVDDTVLSAGPDSEVVLDRFRFHSAAGPNDMFAEMRRGTLSVVSGEITHGAPGALKLKTPTAILGVRGTTFAVQVLGEPR